MGSRDNFSALTGKVSHIIGWSLLIAVNLYFVNRYAFRYFHPDFLDRPFGKWLLLHIVFAMITLLAGPLQFISVIRKRYPPLHRWTGRMYLASVLISATAAAKLAISHNMLAEHRYVFGAGLMGLACAWLITSGIALYAVRKRSFALHKQWMIRNYVVTCSFITFRLFSDILIRYVELNPDEALNMMAWACWSVPLLLTDTVMQLKKFKSGVVTPDMKQAA